MEEIEKTFSKEQAIVEAKRCLYCYDAPCQAACPANVPIPEFIQSIRTDNLKGAQEIIREANPLIEICGRVCPEESFCQSACTRAKVDTPIRIRELHRYITDNTNPSENLELKPATKEKVAIIGGGPAGLACAVELRRQGYKPVIFEKKQLGGIPVNEISKIRLPENISQKEVKFIHHNFIYQTKDIKITSLKELNEDFKAVFIATGLPDELNLNIPNTTLKGVYQAREILKKAKVGIKPQIFKRAGVIGGGNVALEVASVLKREYPNSDVEVIYRRSEKELKAFKKEIEEAIDSGVTFQFLAIPKEIKGKERVEGVVVTRAHLGEKDASGRRHPEPIPHSDFFIPLDLIVIAIGQKASNFFPEIEKDERGLIKVNDDMSTNVKGVFAGGDIVKGPSTIVESVAQGKKAAESIVKYMEGEKNV